MDSKKYIIESERTEAKLPAQDLKPEFTQRLPQLLNYSRVVGKYYDDFKKQLYYGAEITDESLQFSNIEDGCRLAMTEQKLAYLHAALGSMTETCELVEQILEHIHENKKLDEINLEEEMGDVFWYFAIMCRLLGVNFEQMMDKNIEKLKVRFPDKFSQEKALERTLDEERKVLEKK